MPLVIFSFGARTSNTTPVNCVKDLPSVRLALTCSKLVRESLSSYGSVVTGTLNSTSTNGFCSVLGMVGVLMIGLGVKVSLSELSIGFGVGETLPAVLPEVRWTFVTWFAS